jgi:hypothetical protein
MTEKGTCVGSKAQQTRRQQRIGAARATARQAKRRRTVALAVVVIVVLAAIAAGVAVAARHKPAARAAGTPRTSAPPWPAPQPGDVRGLIAKAGLPVLAMEATDVHYHAHLDVLVDGEAVTVPANIGIAGAGALSALHTHTPDGIIHIEAPANDRFTLGQLFTEWNVRFTATCVGGLCADGSHPLRVYVNGTAYDGDPTQLVLAAHQEIAVVYGALPDGQQPPATFTFPKGL